MPLDIFAAFHCREYVPAGNSCDTMVDTSFPNRSNIFNETDERVGIVNDIVVDGLNGSG
jgi:hypothetical protein